MLGEQRYPFPATTDFSSFLLAAQASGANVLGLANAGADTSNCIKQAHEFGLLQTMKIAALLMEITDVKAIGTEIGAGLYVSATFYWDANEGTRSADQGGAGRHARRAAAEHDPGRLLRRGAALPQGADRHGGGQGARTAPRCARR